MVTSLHSRKISKSAYCRLKDIQLLQLWAEEPEIFRILPSNFRNFYLTSFRKGQVNRLVK